MSWMEGRYCINYLNDRLDQLLVIFRYKYKLTNTPDVLSICCVCALYSIVQYICIIGIKIINNNTVIKFNKEERRSVVWCCARLRFAAGLEWSEKLNSRPISISF